jgi:LPXTG-site transpeptidase (sortase) family protein
MSLRVRLRFTKSLLRRSERLCFAFGFACLSCCATIAAHVWLFQAYENWAFEQQLGGEPISVREFLVHAASFSEPAAPAEHSIVGQIEIPRIGLKAMILEGATRRTLAAAVGHIPGTALPGAKGNAALAGHRDTFFRGLKDIRAGDRILVTTLEGSFEYRVKDCNVVGPRDTHVLDDTAEPALTLVTCFPFHYVGPAPERFIVRATRAGS